MTKPVAPTRRLEALAEQLWPFVHDAKGDDRDPDADTLNDARMLVLAVVLGVTLDDGPERLSTLATVAHALFAEELRPGEDDDEDDET